METIVTVLGVALIIFAMVGVLAMIAMLGAMLLVKRGAMLTFGYEQDDNPDE